MLRSRSDAPLWRSADKLGLYCRRYIIWALCVAVALTAALERGCQG